MDKCVIKEIQKEHNGKNFTFPIGALAENVKTDDEHQFVTQQEKKQIGKVKSIEQAFQDGCDLLVSTCTTYGETPASNSPSDIADAIAAIHDKAYNEGYAQSRDDIVTNATVAVAQSYYKVPKNGMCTISYNVDFQNNVANEHNANSADFTLSVGGVTVKTEHKNLANSTVGHTFSGTWTGTVTQGQVIQLDHSSQGWYSLQSKSMTIIIL